MSRLNGESRSFRTAAEVWLAIASMIQELDCCDRCVEYSIDGAVHSYDAVQSWLADVIARGSHTIRYVVDPDHIGLVRVDFAARAPIDSNPPILVEACVDSVASSMAAAHGGARRLELCDALFDGGTTPSAGMIAACKDAVSIPVFVMIRPRGGGFVYSDAERDVMRRDIVIARELGADGVVIGGLLPNGAIDLGLVRFLVDAAQGLPVTFHRAFDLTTDLEASMELLAAAGVQRILTAGGVSTATEGATTLGQLVRRAGSRIVVMAGGGVREENVRPLVSVSGVREVHVRLTRLTLGSEPPAGRGLRVRHPLPEDEAAWEETDEERIRSFVRVVAATSVSV